MKPERALVLTQGFVAGLIGYGAVAVFFLLVNVLTGRSPFHTAAVLGSVLFYGAEGAASLAITPGPIFAYNGLHLVVSLAVGMVAALLLHETERHHFIWYFVFFIFLGGFVFSVIVVGIVGAEIARVVPWWLVAVANAIWAGALGGYLWFQHRGLVTELQREEDVT